MATVKEMAQKEYNSYMGIASLLTSIRASNPKLIASVENQLKKIALNQREISNFLTSKEELSEERLEEKWAEIKANTKIVVTADERKQMKNFFQNVDDSLAKTEEFKNLYKIYLENMVTEKGRDVKNWQKESDQLVTRMKAVTKARHEYDDFNREYQMRKDAVEFGAEELENKRNEHVPEYLDTIRRYEEKYKSQNRVPIFDEKFLEAEAIRNEFIQRVYREDIEKLKANPEANKDEIASLEIKLKQVDKRVEDIREMWHDLDVVTDARERADSYYGIKEYKKLYDEAAKRFEEVDKIQKEYDDVRKKTTELESKIKSDTIVDSIKEKASMLYEMCDLRSAGHTDSKEYTQMIAALDIVQGWNDPNASQEWRNREGAPKTLNEALQQLGEASKSYLDAKNAQWRPFPSALRQSRRSLAESVMDLAANSLGELKLPGKEIQVKDEIAKVQEKQQEVVMK